MYSSLKYSGRPKSHSNGPTKSDSDLREAKSHTNDTAQKYIFIQGLIRFVPNNYCNSELHFDN